MSRRHLRFHRTSILIALTFAGFATVSAQRPPSGMTVTEVQLRYVGSDGHRGALSLDPGEVDVLLLDSQAFATHVKGLPPRERQFQVDSITVRALLLRYPGTFASDTSSIGPGNSCDVRIRTGGNWFVLEDIAQCSEMTISYQVPNGNLNELYEMTLPLGPSGRGLVDAVFWNATARDTYRNGLSAMAAVSSQYEVRPLRYADRAGTYLPGEDTAGFGRVPYPPRRTARAGRFTSSSGAVCYHFESCQWSCVDQ